MWHAAVKMAYEGRDFMGSQRQPEERTVEGEVLRALLKIEAIEDVRQSRFRVASRTDRGVSALGNVFCVDTSFEKDRLLHALNAQVQEVYFHSLAEVPTDFSPRRAKQRWYRYFLPAEGMDAEKVRSSAELFQGRHDFRRFCKSEGRSTVRTLQRIDVNLVGDMLIIDLRAREFLRNMVRRLVAAMAEAGRGRASISELSSVLEGEDRSFGLAPAERLVLMDVSYDLPFEVKVTPPYERELRRKRDDALLRLYLFDMLLQPDTINE